jgi:hypothetical protein
MASKTGIKESLRKPCLQADRRHNLPSDQKSYKARVVALWIESLALSIHISFEFHS